MKENQEQLFKNLEIMEVVEKELNRQKNDAVLSLTVFLCASSVWVLLVALWQKMDEPIPAGYLTWGVEAIAVLMLAFLYRRTDIKLKNLGINRRNLKPTMKRAGIISVLIIAVITAAKLILRPGEAVFDWSRFNPVYVFTSVLQEFLSRGFLLTCLLTIFSGKYSRIMSVTASSLLFTTLHLFYGFNFMVGAGVLSVLLGLLYLKDGNIWGVSLVHFVFGTFGTMSHFV